MKKGDLVAWVAPTLIRRSTAATFFKECLNTMAGCSSKTETSIRENYWQAPSGELACTTLLPPMKLQSSFQTIKNREFRVSLKDTC